MKGIQMTLKPRITLTIGLAVLLGLSLTAPAAAQAQTPAQKYGALLGTWDAQTEDAAYTFIFEFSLEDGTLKGKYTGASGTTPMDKLVFENNNFSFSVTVNDMTLDYSGYIDGDKLTGQVSLPFGQAGITGKKRKA
jgi:hypothetical protein